MIIEIWTDVEEPYQDHYHIAINGKVFHYYHWDSLLLWHDLDIIQAERILIHGPYSREA